MGGRMNGSRGRYDIFICGGSQHFAQLADLLPKLAPHGRVHLASITLTACEIERLRPHLDVVHWPRHAADGYLNFNLFCIRDINRLAAHPHFVKLDADIQLRDDWIEFVDHGVAEHPEAALFGIQRGDSPIDVTLTGPLVRAALGSDVRVAGGWKVRGGFYVGRTAFFRRHDPFMQRLHELVYCFADGRRVRPGSIGALPGEGDAADPPLTVRGNCRNLSRKGDEDTLRSLAVHALGGSKLLLDSGGRVAFSA
jgi:hypothetical protein